MTAATTTSSTEPIVVATVDDVWRELRAHLVELVESGRVLDTDWLAGGHEPHLVTELPHGSHVAYSRKKVDHVIRTLGAFEHIKGRWSRQPLKLFDWQVLYEIAPVFGLVHVDTGLRIIRTAWIEKPRKNGKSTECSGLGLYLAFADGEEGAEVYAAARDKLQAGIVFQPAKTMAERCPALRTKLGTRGILKSVLTNYNTMSVFRPLASDTGGNLHGLNVHGGIIDEVHVHKNPDTIDALETGTGSREQPLVIFITTADEGKTGSIYDTKRTYVENLVSGTIADESFYAVVFAATERQLERDPFSDDTLIQANPGIGYTVSLDYLRAKAREAQNSPAQLNRYLRLHLGKRTKQTIAWLTMPKWDVAAGMLTEADFDRRVTYLGFDLSSTSDFTAATWLAPPIRSVPTYDAWSMFWIPEERVDELEHHTGVPLRRWVKEGWIKATEGNVVDYAVFRADVDAITRRLGCTLAEVAYDPWNATETVTEMENSGYTMIPLRQGYMSLNAPAKELERVVMGSTIEAALFRHGGNPVLRWMADCVEVMQDPAGNIKPSKPDRRSSSKRIDGIASLVNAMSRAMLRNIPKKRRAGGSV